MYVLKTTKPVPEYFEEAFYDEVVSVRNGIALCNHEHVRDALLAPQMDYEYVGVINKESELKDLLKKNLINKNSDVVLNVATKVLSLDDMFKLDEPDVPEITKPWVETLE